MYLTYNFLGLTLHLSHIIHTTLSTISNFFFISLHHSVYLILHFSFLYSYLYLLYKKITNYLYNDNFSFYLWKRKSDMLKSKDKIEYSCLYIGSEKSLHILKIQSYRNMVVTFFFGINSHVTSIFFSIYMINNKANKRSNFLLSLILCLFL